MFIRFKNTILIFGLVLAFNSCSSASEEIVSNPSFSEAQSSSVVLRINKEAFTSLDKNRVDNISKGDAFTINRAERLGSLILLNVSYGGGCTNHEFEVIWDGVIYTNKPCYFNLLLTHNGNNDDCKAYITKDISINLKELFGEVSDNSSCAINIYNTFNSSTIPDIRIN